MTGKQGKALRLIISVLGILALVFALIPSLLYDIHNVGVWALFVIAALFFLLRFTMSKRFYDGRRGFFRGIIVFIRRFTGVILSIFLISQVAFAFIIGKNASFTLPPDNKPYTIIIPGAKTVNSKPMRMFTKRIETGAEVSRYFTNAVILTTGGPGTVEEISQAQAAKNMLMDMGIDESIIYMEEKSIDTDTNFMYAEEIIEKYNLPKDVIIVSDRFHLARCSYYAKKYGMNPTGIACPTPTGLVPAYTLRDEGGICEAILISLFERESPKNMLYFLGVWE